MGNMLSKNPFRILIGLALCLTINTSQAITATLKGSLPSSVGECSGLDFNGNASFWTHNDGFGDNRLYKVGMTGSLQQTITLTGATNFDWEDLTHDVNRDHLFIGDFGNNDCDRTNLRIYKIPYPNSSTTTVTPEIIEFTFSDQTDFPSAWMNFDVEAFLHFNGRLYLFTKADGSAIGYTKMYSLSENAGTKVANLVDSFYTNDRTTAADVSPSGDAMILMSNSHIHIFKNFSGSDFFGGDHTQVNISGGWTQKEAVAFTSDNEIYIADEDNGNGNNVYYLSLSNYIAASTTTAVNEVENSSTNVYPNPATEIIHFDLSKQFNSVTVQLYDITGKMIATSSFSKAQEMVMDINKFSPGVYFYKLITDGRLLKTERIVLQ